MNARFACCLMSEYCCKPIIRNLEGGMYGLEHPRETLLTPERCRLIKKKTLPKTLGKKRRGRTRK